MQILSLQKKELKDVTQNMPNMETLVLSGCYNLSDDRLMPAFGCMMRDLTVLNLSMCKKITDLSVEQICHNVPRLQRLDLAGCSSLSNASLTLIQHHLKQLLHLNLRSCRNLTDDGIARLCGQPTSPQFIVNNYPNKGEEAAGHREEEEYEVDVEVEEEGLTRLEFLGLQDCQKLTDDSLKHVSQGLPNLRSINLSFCASFTEFGLKHLSTMASSLKEINLRSCDNVSDIGLRYLSEGGVALHVLDISFCDKISDQGLEFVSQGLPQIQSLSLNSCSVSDKGIVKIAATLTELRTLNIGQCNEVTDKGLNAIIDNCPQLKDVDVYGCTGISTPTIDRLIQLNVNLSRELWPDTCFPHVSSNSAVAHVRTKVPRMHHESLPMPPTALTADHYQTLVRCMGDIARRHSMFPVL